MPGSYEERGAIRPSTVLGFLLAAGVLALCVIAIACSWSAEAWTAIATWVTAGIALAAALVALSQLGEARRLRVEQAQPYVVVLMELSAPHSKAIDLVVKNLGKTAAMEVRLEIDPKPVRIGGGDAPTDVWLPEQLPVLVPGQEWRTMWDLTTARGIQNLPIRHAAVVTYKDSHGTNFRFEYVLDWAPYFYRASLVVHDVHEGVEKLGKIEQAIKLLAKAIGRS